MLARATTTGAGMARTTKSDTEFNHFSQAAPEYVEVILWRRVALVLGALVTSLAAVGWLMFQLLTGTPDQAGGSGTSLIPDRLAAPGAIPESSSASDNATTPAATSAQQTAETREADSPSPIAVNDPATANPAPAAAASTNPAEKNSAEETLSVPSTAATMEASEPATVATDSIPERFSVKTEILMPTIHRAVLTDQMHGLEPARAITDTSDLAQQPKFSLYQFVDIRGQAGNTLTYVWKREGKVMARVRIPVGSDKWRNYSSKNFNPRLLGNWEVEVIDKQNRLLVRSRFYLGRLM